MAEGERQLPFEYWEMLKDGREEEFYQHAIGFVLTSEQFVSLTTIPSFIILFSLFLFLLLERFLLYFYPFPSTYLHTSHRSIYDDKIIFGLVCGASTVMLW